MTQAVLLIISQHISLHMTNIFRVKVVFVKFSMLDRHTSTEDELIVFMVFIQSSQPLMNNIVYRNAYLLCIFVEKYVRY